MKFLGVKIEEFGKLEHRSFDFGNGITLVEGDNESGKSTLLAFLRFALYGFPRRNAAGGEERDRRLSFRNRRAAGSLTLLLEGQIYRIFRSVTAKNERDATETLSVTKEPEGRTVELNGKTPGEFFLGIPAELYDSSLCVAQSEIERVGEGDVSDRVGELLTSTEGAARAEKILENSRRTLCHRKGRGGRIPALEDEEAGLTQKIAEASETAAALAALGVKEKSEAGELARYKAGLAALDEAMEKARLGEAMERHRELCRADEEVRGGTLRIRELETQLAALPDDAALSSLGALLGSKRESRQEFLRADAALRNFEPKLPPAEAVLAQGSAERELPEKPHAGATPEKDGTGEKNPAKAAPGKKAAHLMPWSRFFCDLFAVFTLAVTCAAIAAMGKAPDFVLPFSPVFLWIAAGGLLLITLACGIYTRLRHGRKVPQMSEAHSAAKEAYSRALESFLDLQNVLDSEWKRTCGASLACAADPEAVLREYARERGEILSETAAKKEARDRAAGKAAFLRERGGSLDEEAVKQRYAELAALSLPEGNWEELSARRKDLNRQAADCEARLTATRQALATLAAGSTDPATLSRTRAEVREKLAAAKENLAALNLAAEALVAAQTELRRDIAPALCTAAGKIFGQLRNENNGGFESPMGNEESGEPCEKDSGTGSLHIGTDFRVLLWAEGDRHPLSCFSAGCRDAAYLSLRIALTRLLTGEPLPLLLDEPAARLDDHRAAALLSCLAEIATNGGQCILFSCHHREAALLAPLAPFDRITL